MVVVNDVQLKEIAMSPVRTSFGFHSTAEEVLDGVDLSGMRAVVTGASSGIGVETVRALARAGAEVTLAVRNTDAGWAVANQLAGTHGSMQLRVQRLDL